MKTSLFVLCLCLSYNTWAGVYKCTSADGRTNYQSSPCTEDRKAVQINTKTGNQVDLNQLEKQQQMNAEQLKQLEMEQQASEQAKLAAIQQRNQSAQAQSEQTQALVKQNPLQFSAYAIPAYTPDKLPATVKPFEERLADIEKFRRLAAQKALSTNQCQRVEADELHTKSTKAQLVFLINCSSGASYYFNESELAE